MVPISNIEWDEPANYSENDDVSGVRILVSSSTCMQQLSMIRFSYLIFGYSSATSAQLCRKSPSPSFLFRAGQTKSYSVVQTFVIRFF